MAITTGDGYIASSKQIVPYVKTAALTTTASSRFTVRGQNGNPTAATLAAATTPGALFTDASSGFPVINTFAGGATGYLTRVNYSGSVAGRLELFDMLYGVNVSLTALGTTTVTAPPSYLARCPSGIGVEVRVFVEVTTTVSATATTVQITYTNSAGVTGRTSLASGTLSGLTAGRWAELTLQTNDQGIQKIESVIVGGTVATAGAVNIVIARPLWSQRIGATNAGGVDGIDRTGMPIVYDTSALALCVAADSTSSGTPDCLFEIANA